MNLAPATPRPARAGRATFDLGEAAALADKFKEHFAARSLSKRTPDDYAVYISRFLRWLRENIPVDSLADLTPAHLRAYQTAIYKSKTRRANAPLSLYTISSILIPLRTFFRWLVRSGYLLADPSTSIALPKLPHQIPRGIPTPREVARIIAACPDTPLGVRDRAVVELLYGAAIRNSELCALGQDDVDLECGTVRVHGKGGRERVVPCGAAAVSAIRAYLKTSRPRLARSATAALFISCRGRALRLQTPDDILRGRTRKAGIKKRIHPHLLRHACATHMLHGGANLRHVQAQLGHASLNTTQIYTHLTITDLRRVHAKTHPRERAAAETEA